MRRTLLLLVFTIAAIFAPMATAQACSCMMPDAARFLAESDFVFAGSLVERPGGVAGQAGEFGLENVAYRFEVDAVYKGDLRDATVEVWSASNGAACGFELAVGEPVAIAASLAGGQLTGGLCATFGVDQLEAAAEQAGIEPTFPASTPPSNVDAAGEPASSPGAASAVTAVAVLAGVVAAGLIVALRRRTRV